MIDALCLGVNILPHHLHNQDTFPFWLFALSLMEEQWKILVKGSSSVSSPPPLSTNKSTKLLCAVSAETVVSHDGVVGSFNIAGPTEGRWGALILKWIDMDEPAQCFAVAYAAAADVVRWCCLIEELWTVPEKNLNLFIERIILEGQVSTLAEQIV